MLSYHHPELRPQFVLGICQAAYTALLHGIAQDALVVNERGRTVAIKLFFQIIKFCQQCCGCKLQLWQM